MRTTEGLVLLLLVASPANARPPRFMPDEEMARLPIVVIGKWDKAPLKAHELVKDNVRSKLEAHTELTVERVIKGDIKPGKHKLLLSAFIGWAEKGGPVISYTSTEMIGDAEEVTKPNLWLLTRKQSWDAADNHVYLCLEDYRAVQPLQLEEYFRALGAKDYQTAVPQLLSSREPLVLHRTLAFLTGGVLPWPYEPGDFGEYLGWKARWKPMVQHAGEVEKVLNHKERKVRHLAAAVYAELAGKDAIPRMRQLLQDDDAEIRGIASGTLIRHKYTQSYEDICGAVKGIKQPDLGCQLLALISEANSTALVPGAIEFLQIDGCAGGLGDDFYIPAFKAQAALKTLTGHDFPFDVMASRTAWGGAKGLAPQKRKEFLARALPYNPKPLAGRLLVDAKGVVAIIANRSDKPLWLAKVPDELDLTWTNGVGGGSFPDNDIKGKESFVQLAPGKSLRVPLDEERIMRPMLTRLILRYHHNGNQHGVNAWIGPVDVSFGEHTK